jgi:hypothetical protein
MTCSPQPKWMLPCTRAQLLSWPGESRAIHGGRLIELPTRKEEGSRAGDGGAGRGGRRRRGGRGGLLVGLRIALPGVVVPRRDALALARALFRCARLGGVPARRPRSPPRAGGDERVQRRQLEALRLGAGAEAGVARRLGAATSSAPSMYL